MFRKLLSNRRGATAIEYGLIAVLVSVAAAGVLQLMGVNVTTLFTNANGKIIFATTVN